MAKIDGAYKLFRRETLRYRNRWVRLLCAFGVGCVCWHLYLYTPIATVEQTLFDILAGYGMAATSTVAFSVKVALVLAVCLLPAILLVERPLVMVICGASYAVLYAVGAGYILTLRGMALPLAVPLLGIFASTAVMETMAWSEERYRRRQLERVDRTRQQFIDLLAHDLRRRLSSIRTSLSLLRKGAPPDPRAEELMNTLGASADRMLIQINALLDVRRIQEGRMTLRRENVSLDALLDDALREYRPTSELVGVVVDTSDCRAGPVSLLVDRDVFSRVIANLLWNALRHAPAGSTVRIGTDRSPAGGLDLHVTNDSDPIPAELLPSLFQAFVAGPPGPHSGQGSGTGLGLAFCKLAVEVHDGSIRIDSPLPGQARGVRVIVSLPASAVLPA